MFVLKFLWYTARDESLQGTVGPMSKHLAKNTLVFSLMTFISRILGFVRDMVIAYLFGVTGAADAFWVAFKIPNFMRRLFAEGSFSQAFIPVLAEYKETHDHKIVLDFISHMMASLALVLMALTVLVELATPLMTIVFAPGYLHDPLRFNLASQMLHLTFPYLFFISLTAFFGSILNTYGRFGIPAFTPALLNICMIMAALWLTPYCKEPIMALSWGVFISGVVQCLFQLPFLWARGLLPWPRLKWRDAGVVRVLKLMGPAIFGVSVGQINLLIDTVFASFLPVGSISWLYYSDRLTSFPLGVFGVAISTVVLPTLAKAFSRKSDGDYSATVDWSIRTVLLISIPATVAFLVLNIPMLSTLFQHGVFKTHDVIMTAKSLSMFALGIPGFMLIKVLASGFYARQNVKTPVKIGIIAMVTNTFISLILIFPMAHAGLALSTSISSTLNAALLFYFLIRDRLYVPGPGWGRYWLQMGVANVIMGGLLWMLSDNAQTWLAADGAWRAWHLSGLFCLAVASYFAVLWLMGLRLRHFLSYQQAPL